LSGGCCIVQSLTHFPAGQNAFLSLLGEAGENGGSASQGIGEGLVFGKLAVAVTHALGGGPYLVVIGAFGNAENREVIRIFEAIVFSFEALENVLRAGLLFLHGGGLRAFSFRSRCAGGG
jgi:hypothetical protein